jgi:hypothetical protein
LCVQWWETIFHFKLIEEEIIFNKKSQNNLPEGDENNEILLYQEKSPDIIGTGNTSCKEIDSNKESPQFGLDFALRNTGTIKSTQSIGSYQSSSANSIPLTPTGHLTSSNCFEIIRNASPEINRKKIDLKIDSSLNSLNIIPLISKSEGKLNEFNDEDECLIMPENENLSGKIKINHNNFKIKPVSSYINCQEKLFISVPTISNSSGVAKKNPNKTIIKSNFFANLSTNGNNMLLMEQKKNKENVLNQSHFYNQREKATFNKKSVKNCLFNVPQVKKDSSRLRKTTPIRNYDEDDLILKRSPISMKNLDQDKNNFMKNKGKSTRVLINPSIFSHNIIKEEEEFEEEINYKSQCQPHYEKQYKPLARSKINEVELVENVKNGTTYISLEINAARSFHKFFENFNLQFTDSYYDFFQKNSLMRMTIENIYSFHYLNSINGNGLTKSTIDSKISSIVNGIFSKSNKYHKMLFRLMENLPLILSKTIDK